MTLLLAAVGAMATALLELSVGPYLRVASSQPHLVLVLGVIVTIAIGLEAGLAWGFIGGLVLDVLAQRPLGSSPFALLLCVGGAFVLARLLSRLRAAVPILATFLLSLLYSMTLFVAFNALRATIPVADPIAATLPGAVYDAVLAALIGPLAVTIHDRRAEVERVDW
jgi:rod shape-determining protein MreD